MNFDFKLGVCVHKFVKREIENACVGQTIVVSSAKIMFSVGEHFDLKENDRVLLKVEWPVKLDDGTPLHLKIWGWVISVDGRRFEVSIEQYKICTGPARPKKQVAA